MAETSPRRGLGRGLDALLGESTTARRPPAPGELPLDAIRPNPSQPRRSIEPASLEALTESIRETGVVQPVVVRPQGPDGIHELIAGERRWRAARAAGLERIPAVIRAADDAEALEVGLIENLAREDLNAIDTAHACATLIEDFGRTHAELGRRLGRSRSAVSNVLRLLELPDDVQAMVVDGRLTEGHARAVLRADGARARRRLAERIVAESLSVRQAEAAAAAAGNRSARARPPRPPAIADDARAAFEEICGAPARVRARRDGGLVVELRFADESELGAALDRLRGGVPAD